MQGKEGLEADGRMKNIYGGGRLHGKANYSHSNDSISISGRAQEQKKGEMPVSLLLLLFADGPSVPILYTYTFLAHLTLSVACRTQSHSLSFFSLASFLLLPLLFFYFFFRPFASSNITFRHFFFLQLRISYFLIIFCQ